MTEIWLTYTDMIEKKEDMIQSMIEVLKKGMRDSNKNLKLNALAFGFKLLDQFSEAKNHSAPAIFKALIFSLIESPDDLTIRSFYYTNFQDLFEAH